MLDEAAAELTGVHGGSVKGFEVDIRDAASVDAMVGRIWDDGGALTGLINNAAGNFISRTEDLSPRGFDAIANTVFHGTFYTTNAVGKRWIEGGHKGSILSIVVTWVWTGSPFVVPSAMSKAGVDVMTKSLAVEWGRYGIRLNAIAPGIFPTEGATARLRPGDDPHNIEMTSNPMRRLGKMDELTNLAAFLMADGCEWLTGQTIAIDGANYLANGSYFTHYMDWTDEDWKQARERIKAQTAKDKALRTATGPGDPGAATD
jgi:NAD(P)-dependent dehydrogenase (short-subunit alcohol dehydrogenase family)